MDQRYGRRMASAAAAEASPPLLEARHLSVAIGRRIILHPTDFTVVPGEWMAVVGPNGAGKSTLLRAVAGTMPRRGDLFFNGTPVKQCALQFRRALGVLFHEPLLYPALTALENLLFVADAWGLESGRSLAFDWLEKVGMRAFANERVAGFSKGMTQRLALARALMTEPALLLLDEPLAGLDTAGQTDLLHLFERAKANGVSAFWVTHRPDLAAPLVDATIAIERGYARIAGDGGDV